VSKTIKYRVWDKTRKKMSPVATIHFRDDGSALTIMIDPAPKGPHIDLVEGENAVLMQFTGLLDKNGCEIYEGDILFSHALDISRTNDDYAIVDAGVSLPAGSLLFAHIKTDPQKVPVAFSDTGSVEVIGNVYENQDLLEQQRAQCEESK